MQILLLKIKLYPFKLKYNYYKLISYWFLFKNKLVPYNTVKYGINLINHINMLDKMIKIKGQEKQYVINIIGDSKGVKI